MKQQPTGKTSKTSVSLLPALKNLFLDSHNFMELMANVLKRISSCIYFLNTQRTNNNKIKIDKIEKNKLLDNGKAKEIMEKIEQCLE